MLGSALCSLSGPPGVQGRPYIIPYIMPYIIFRAGQAAVHNVGMGSLRPFGASGAALDSSAPLQGGSRDHPKTPKWAQSHQHYVRHYVRTMYGLCTRQVWEASCFQEIWPGRGMGTHVAYSGTHCKADLVAIYDTCGTCDLFWDSLRSRSCRYIWHLRHSAAFRGLWGCKGVRT